MGCMFCGDDIEESICVNCEDTADAMGVDVSLL